MKSEDRRNSLVYWDLQKLKWNNMSIIRGKIKHKGNRELFAALEADIQREHEKG